MNEINANHVTRHAKSGNIKENSSYKNYNSTREMSHEYPLNQT